jgi:predicted nuclease of predicted toxin-antitoxin system
VRFLLDQSADARLIPHLTACGHDAVRIGREYPHGLPDARVLTVAHAEQRILITADLDFGELVARMRLPHAGVILFRLGDYAELALKVERLDHILTHYGDQLGQFLVVTRTTVRVRRGE